MTDTPTLVRQRYAAPDLTARIQDVLTATMPTGQALSVEQLAPLDQFHTRGIAATAELAAAADLRPSSRVLDIGCGIGGPARYLAAAFGCKVTGVDMSEGFIDAARYLTARTELSDSVTFQFGDALQLDFDDGAFDAVFLQHVAMNIADRGALYAEVRRLLARGGRFAMYDVVLREGEIMFPVPWAGDASTSFLLSESATRLALAEAGFKPILWRDDSEVASEWFRTALSGGPPRGLHLGLVLGPDFVAATSNLARNLREHRLGVLSAVLIRD